MLCAAKLNDRGERVAKVTKFLAEFCLGCHIKNDISDINSGGVFANEKADASSSFLPGDFYRKPHLPENMDTESTDLAVIGGHFPQKGIKI